MRNSSKEIINYYLKRALLEKSFVLLPGTGVFYLVRYPAKIESKTEIISPPGYAVDFVPSSNISDYFLAYYIAENSNSSFNFWNEELKKFSEEINRLPEGEKFDLDSLGVFHRAEKEGLQYHHHGLIKISGLNALESFACKPLPLVFKSTEKSVITEGTTSSEPVKIPVSPPKSRKKRLSPLGWFLIILSAVVFSALFYDRCSKADIVDIVPPPHISMDRFNQAPEILNVDSFQKEDSNHIEKEYFESEEDTDFGYSDDFENQFPSGELKEGLQDKKEKEKEKESDIDDSSIGHANDLLKIGGRCVIITGSFSRESNIKNQSSQLEKLGYSVYTENIGSLTRVGVLVDCSAENLNRELGYIRTNIEPAAWIMEDN